MAIFQIALAMKFFEIWPQFSWQMWPYLAFGKNMLISGPFGLILGPFWPNFTFQFNIHKILWQKTNFSNNFHLRIFRFALWKFFSKKIWKISFPIWNFLQKLSHKNAIKTENRVKIHRKSGHIVAIFEKFFGHNGHDFQCYWPYLVAKSWEHCTQPICLHGEVTKRTFSRNFQEIWTSQQLASNTIWKCDSSPQRIKWSYP